MELRRFQMDGVDRAAILLLGIGEEKAALVLKHLEPRQVQKVGLAMTAMANVSKSQIQMVVDEFLSEAEQQTSLGVDSEDYIRRMLLNALGEEKATPVIESILTNEEETGLDKLKWMDSRQISDLLRNEHPQIIATILTYLDSDQAAEVLAFFGEKKRLDLILRMCSIDTVKPEALSELGQIIEKQMEGLKKGKATSIGGVKSVADMINFLESNVESQVLDALKDYDDSLYEKIQEKMFVFENLVDMDSRSVQTLLRDVSSEVLMLALKGTTEKVKDKIFTNMSKRAAELLRDDLDAMGPVKVSEVEEAQKEVLSAARKLAESGEISLGGKGGEEMI